MSLQIAAVVVISDKILENKKWDNISQYLIAELNGIEYNVVKATVIPQRESVIVNEFKSLVKQSDIIIAVGEKCTTIYKAIATMIFQELQHSEELATAMKENDEAYDENEVVIPVQARIIHSHVYPIVHFQRIFILKEKYMTNCFAASLKTHLMQYRKPYSFTKVIKVCQNGNTNVDADLKVTNVNVQFSKDDQFLLFKVTSPQLSQIVDFQQKIKNRFGIHYCNSFVDDSNVWDDVYASLDNHQRNSIEIISNCLKQYQPENVFICFNGGKDCTALLHLVLTIMKKQFSHYTQPIFCLYVQSEDPFPEQDEFINLYQCYYNLQILTIRTQIKHALSETLLKYPNYKACLMGTRRTDPYSATLNVFQMTDPDWPQIMRVSPLLDWHYSDIWDYLLYYKVPYCKLYDMGFTSLGNVANTIKNPALIDGENSATKVYLPAHKLLMQKQERNGRISNNL